MSFANTPNLPYYAVIFTSLKNDDTVNYNEVANRMMALVKTQPGFLGVESARESLGITVSYWKDIESIQNWKKNFEHEEAQQHGKSTFYKAYKVRICKVERDYDFNN